MPKGDPPVLCASQSETGFTCTCLFQPSHRCIHSTWCILGTTPSQNPRGTNRMRTMNLICKALKTETEHGGHRARAQNFRIIESTEQLPKSSFPAAYQRSKGDVHPINVARVQRERARGLQECAGDADTHTDEGEGAAAQTKGSGCDTTPMGEEERTSTS